MNWKELFKPTIVKTILLILFFGISFQYSTIFANVGGASQFGYPFQFIQFAGCYGPVDTPYHHCWDNEVNYANLITDLIIWYLVAVIIVGLYKTIRKQT